MKGMSTKNRETLAKQVIEWCNESGLTTASIEEMINAITALDVHHCLKRGDDAIKQPSPLKMDCKDVEYKIICGSANYCQHFLNRWRSKFKLNVITMAADKDCTTVLLTRSSLFCHKCGRKLS